MITMNLHDISSITLGEICSAVRSDGSTFYWRAIEFRDSKGHRILSVDSITDNGYNLLVSDPVIDELNAPLKEAA